MPSAGIDLLGGGLPSKTNDDTFQQVIVPARVVKASAQATTLRLYRNPLNAEAKAPRDYSVPRFMVRDEAKDALYFLFPILGFWRRDGHDGYRPFTFEGARQLGRLDAPDPRPRR